MAWQNIFFVAHRKHPRFGFKTIEIASAEHLAFLRMGNYAVARNLGLIHIGDNLFRVPDTRDQESVMQAVEKSLSAYDEAVSDGAS